MWEELESLDQLPSVTASRVTANAQENNILGEGSGITVEKLEQFLKNLPRRHKLTVNHAQTEEENDNTFAGFAGMVSCFCANGNVTE